MTRKKVSTKEFIEKVKIIHEDRYDYSKVNYINAHTKVEIICPKHGSFFQKPNNHLTGRGCLKCKKQISKSETEFLDYVKISKENGYKIKYLWENDWKKFKKSIVKSSLLINIY